ncbi:hypothetical protein [Spartinivicinus ruber]|uniref:hypothetical protein n=1 Tax=Spartinivicinus ruber TaxID=2683272 RepID=UPI0013D3A4C7|nr:hypothetical protein [Spartinivicinus ruber]
MNKRNLTQKHLGISPIKITLFCLCFMLSGMSYAGEVADQQKATQSFQDYSFPVPTLAFTYVLLPDPLATDQSSCTSECNGASHCSDCGAVCADTGSGWGYCYSVQDCIAPTGSSC